MATKQQQKGGDGFTSHVAGMSKNQLYDIMSQMKTLIEQNQQQARQILIDNPSLTKSLFQAQIMLGMVRPPQVMPNIKQAMSQQPQQPAQTVPKLNIPTPQPMPADSGGHGQASSSQPQLPIRQQFQPPASHPPLPFQSQAIPSNAVPSSQQARGHVPTISPPLNSQVHNLPPPPPHATQQPPFQSHLPGVSNQMQHSTQSTVMMHQPLQPPLPPHARPPSLQPFSQQMHSQAPHNLGFQPSNAPPQHLSQSMFHSGANLPVSFQQGQPPLPAQPPPQHLYQASPHIGSDFSTTGAAPMHLDRVAPWVPGLPDNVGSGSQLTGPPPQPLMTSGQGSQPSRPPQLPPEIEKSLLQQVMSLTPEQINLLPPEQRQQVLQLQQMLR